MAILFNSYSEPPFNQLSNFYPVPFIYKGTSYASSEHAYQAAKCALPKEAARVRQANNASTAKKLGKTALIVPNWNDVKFTVMKEILRCKFYQDQKLRQLLISTKGTELIHEASWDSVWGNGKDGKGMNHLGKQLMEIREEIINTINRSDKPESEQ